MKLTRYEYIPASIIALAILIMSAVMFAPRAHAQDVKCFVGGSVGYGISAMSVSDTESSIKLATQTPIIAPEVGCKMSISSIMLGGLLRYDFLDIKGNSIGGNGRWMAAATLGWSPLPGGEIYTLAGFSGTRLKFDGEAETFQAYVLGAGVNIALSKNLKAFGEYNAFIGRAKFFEDFRAAEKGHVGRAGLRLEF